MGQHSCPNEDDSFPRPGLLLPRIFWRDKKGLFLAWRDKTLIVIRTRGRLFLPVLSFLGRSDFRDMPPLCFRELVSISSFFFLSHFCFFPISPVLIRPPAGSDIIVGPVGCNCDDQNHANIDTRVCFHEAPYSSKNYPMNRPSFSFCTMHPTPYSTCYGSFCIPVFP